MPRLATCLLLLAAAAGASPGALAGPVCGDVLYAPVTLIADMNCTTGDGFVIGADNVRVDLNGFDITSPDTAGTAGIRSSGFSGVKIVGPGKIRGFFTSVSIEGGAWHEISGIDAAAMSSQSQQYLLPAIALRDVTDSLVKDSVTGYIRLGTATTSTPAARNWIVGNLAEYIHLEGCQSYGNEIYNNEVRPRVLWANAINLGAATRGNRVAANRTFGGIVLSGRDNLVEGNEITLNVPPWTGYAGVSLANTSAACLAGAVLPVRDNVVRANAITGGTIGVDFMGGAVKNRAYDNKIRDLAIGYRFLHTALDNDARGNSLTNVTMVAIDQGLGNFWP